MVVLTDGGFSSQIENYIDKKVMEDSPLWSSVFLASDPESVLKTHADYIMAGSEIISTNTFQASVDGFIKYLNLSQCESEELIKKAVLLAQKSIQNTSTEQTVKVAGSVGPYGACLCDGSEYRGDYVDHVTPSELKDWHRPRISALLQAGVDLLAIETIPATVEAVSLLQLLRDEFPQAKAWVSFTCKDNEHTSHGERFREAVAECCRVNPAQLVAVGVNCLAPAQVTPLLTSVHSLDASGHVPFIVYPNSGETWQSGVGWTNKEACQPLVQYLPEWISLGVQFIGGCCRINADDIKQCRKYLDSHPS